MASAERSIRVVRLVRCSWLAACCCAAILPDTASAQSVVDQQNSAAAFTCLNPSFYTMSQTFTPTFSRMNFAEIHLSGQAGAAVNGDFTLRLLQNGSLVRESAHLIVPAVPSSDTRLSKAAWLVSEAQAHAMPFQVAPWFAAHVCGSRKLGARAIETSPFTPPPVNPVPAVSEVRSPPEKWTSTAPWRQGGFAGMSPTAIWTRFALPRQPV